MCAMPVQYDSFTYLNIGNAMCLSVTCIMVSGNYEGSEFSLYGKYLKLVLFPNNYPKLQRFLNLELQLKATMKC